MLERADPRDEDAIRKLERQLGKLDPKRRSLEKLQGEIAAYARSLVQRYQGAELPMMVMDLSWRLGNDLKLPDLFPVYEEAVRAGGRSLAIWDLAYNEHDLDGWSSAGNTTFESRGEYLDAHFEDDEAGQFDFRTMALDRVASGDFSMEVQVLARKGENVFSGIVFGQKDANSFHAVIWFPGKPADELAEGVVDTGYVDMTSFYGPGQFKTWHHIPIGAGEAAAGAGRTSTGGKWHTLRIDVSSRFVDLWIDGQLYATQEFPSLAVLQGRFGLICGLGSARFRNVRYLARDPRDPASAIEREVRLESVRGEGKANPSGSYLGVVPPWPSLERVLGNERSSWEEAGPVPQLLALWSIEQNEAIEITKWLTDVHQRYADTGLRVVSVCSPNDAERIEEYLVEHPLPDTVGVDLRPENTIGIGETNELFFTRRFNLPRVLLLDIDQRVVWEGDPGFSVGLPFEQQEVSFLETPLSELVARRKLVELFAWRPEFERAAAALHDGDLAAALPVLQAALELDDDTADEVGRARAWLAAVETAIAEPANLRPLLERDEADPAMQALLDWFPLFGKEVTKEREKALKFALASKTSKDWTTAIRAMTRYGNQRGEFAGKAAELIGRLRPLTGRFPAELADDLEAALGDEAAFDELVAQAAQRPRRWLARSVFGW